MYNNRISSGYRRERTGIRSYFDEPDETQKVYREERPHPNNRGKKRARKRRPSAVVMFIADVVIAAIALYVFALFYFILPKDESQNAQVLPNQLSMASPTPVKPSDAGTAPSDRQSAENSPEPSVSVQNQTTWGVKFPDKFTTDGSVEKTDNSYKSGNINVTVNKVQQNGVTYYVADIYLSDIKYFRTAFAQGKFGTGIHETTDTIAKENNAVIAINGDYCGNNAGPVVRNGTLYRDKTYTSDLLVLNNDGSMQTFSPKDFDINKIKSEGAYQVWTFGPMLLKDGQPMDKFNCSVNPANPRTGIGYYEPGHYCFVVVDGRQPGYSSGYSTKDISQLFYSLGCKVAYNLDGGQSTEMAFEGSLINQPYNGGRETSDIVYIADN